MEECTQKQFFPPEVVILNEVKDPCISSLLFSPKGEVHQFGYSLPKKQESKIPTTLSMATRSC
jgi:hypothetical protein